MAIIAKDNKVNFTPPEEGIHQAVCVDVVDLGMIDTRAGKQRHKVKIVWELEAENPETKKPFLASRRYTLSLFKEAHLRKDLETWRARKFTPDELDGFDLERLIGANCQLQILHNPDDDGRVWANVQAIIPITKNMTKLAPSPEYVREKDRATEQKTAPVEITDDDIPF